jgi:ribose transport system ATP-binding protein
MGDVILKAEDISKSFPGVKALDSVQFELKAGEVHALLGENGAGKSTLMKILAGVQEPDSGRLVCRGKEVRFRNTLEARAAGIGIIFQELNLVPHLTVAQNLFIGREHKTRWGTLDEGRMNLETERVLSRLNLKISPSALVKHLPISKQQMVEIAKALSHQSDVLIMDEPTSALTEAEIDELFQVIHGLRNQGVGIIYISHRLDELQHIVDRITIFRDGKYISTTRFGELTMDEIVNRMVGRELVNQYPPRHNTPTADKILEVENLSSHGVLEPLSFDLFRGEILGIAGLMGSGRSELARALFGADPVDTKTVRINGKPVVIHKPTDAIRHGLAYLSEDRKNEGLAVRMQVSENITMANLDGVCSLPGVLSTTRELTAARKWVDELNIRTPTLQQKVNNLSGGNQQKVVVAKWLFREAKILIFDEPTRGIDVGAKYAIYELMEALARRGVGVMMISSELPEILGMTDRILVLHEGSLAATLTTAQTHQQEILAYASGLGAAKP